MRSYPAAIAVLALAAVSAPAQTGNSGKADSYYHYSLGHLYAELAGSYGSRGDYFDKAVDNYWQAMKEDPSAGFIAEELSDFFIQSGRLRDGVTQAEDLLKKDPSNLNARRVLARVYMRLIGDRQHNQIDETMVKKALEQFQKIVAANPKDLESWILLGQLEKLTGDSNDAMAAYQKALALDPDNQDALTGLALVYSDLGENMKAADLLNKVAQKDPSPRTLAALADTYERMKEYSLAAETLRHAIDRNPDANPDLKRALAQDLLLAGKEDEALKIYEGLIADDPRDAQSYLRISQIYREKRDFPKAREAAAKAHDIDPTDLQIRYNDVNLLEAEGKLPEAIATLSEILSNTAKKEYTDPERSNRAILVDHLGFLYRSNEQYEKAVDAFRQVAQLDPDSAPRAEAQIVDTYRAARSFDKAVDEANAALVKYPTSRIVAEMRASVLGDVGRYDEAIAATKKLMDGKNDAAVDIDLAQLYDKAKRYDDMAQALDAAEKANPSKEDQINVHFIRGAMYEKLKKYEPAEAEFRKVLDLDPTNASAANYIGYMLAERDIRLTEARDFINKALQLDPNNGAYLDSLGWVDYRLNDLTAAESNLRRALEHMSTDPTVHDHLGDVLFRQGKIRDAIAQWQNSVKQWQNSAPGDQDPEELAKVQKKLENARVRLAKESPSGETSKHP